MTERTITKKNGEQNVKVLYQKMGDRWFAFSIVGGEVFMGSITQEEIDRLELGHPKETFALNGNS
ncbi:hypothetical protein WDW37_01620 [Bdellovibrionota bacterium FG-1]